MSIQTALTNLETKRQNIITAIQDKGGTVSDTATLSDCATAIEDIPTGGSGDDVLINLLERDITSINIPSGCTKIGASSFLNCILLTSVHIPNTVTNIESNAFQSCIKLTTVTIPDSVINIYYGAFYGCTSLTTLTIGNSVSTIDSSVFFRCVSLTSVSIPDSVTTMSQNVFQECTGLTSVLLGNGLTSLGSNLFYGCTSLTTVTCTPTTPPTIGTQLFTNCTNLTKIIVPYTSVSAYKTATNWNTYASYIKAGLEITSYKSLTITADDVIGNVTTTTVHCTYICDGVDTITGDTVTDIEYNEDVTSEEFPQNTSTTETVTRTITYTNHDLTATTTFTQDVWYDTDLTLGENTIDNSDETKTQYKYTSQNRTGRLYSFVAPATTSYTFSFDDNVTGGTNSDTYGYLFSEDMTVLKYDDDSAGHGDPKFTYNCTVKTKYYVMITPYSAGSTNNVKGTLTIS